MNQPQELNIACTFNRFLVCQMPPDIAEVELRIKTKWGKFILLKGFHPRTEKYRPWNRGSYKVKIHSRKRQPCHNSTEGEPHNPMSTDSGTFITSSYGMGYPPKIFTSPNYVDSGTDIETIPLHIPNLDKYCQTCISKKTRCICKPLLDWDADLLDITQLDSPN